MPMHKPTIGPPLFAASISVISFAALLVVDHGPWSKPKVQPAQLVQYGTTSAAAKAVGATVTPTPPKAPIEPTSSGPKPVQPAVPDQSVR